MKNNLLILNLFTIELIKVSKFLHDENVINIYFENRNKLSLNVCFFEYSLSW